MKKFLNKLSSFVKPIFVPNNEELLHFYWGAIVFLILNTYVSALATLITMIILSLLLSAWRHYNLNRPFLLKTLLFAIVPLVLWFVALTINKWI